MRERTFTIALVFAAAVAASAAVGCPGLRAHSSPGLNRADLPAEVRGDYDLFARRCSKCHALSRPLDSGITSDAYWVTYVDKMHHMPGSGISDEDEVAILRFLKVYAARERARAQEAAP